MCGLECYAFQKHHWSATDMAEALNARKSSLDLHVDMNDFVQSAVVCLAQPATKRPSTLRNWQAGPKRLGPSCRHGPVRLTSSTHATNTWALPRASLERLARVVTGWSHGRCSPHRQDGCGSVNHVPREMNRTKEELSPQTHVCDHCVHRQIVHREHRHCKLNGRPL